MARETSQQRDKRTQSKPRTSAGTQNSRNQSPSGAQSAKSGGERQAPIQTSRDENLGGRQSQQNQPNQSNQTVRAQNTAASPGASGVVRSGSSSLRGSGAANPFELMQRMSDDMDRLFQQFGFGRSGIGLGPIFGASQGFGVDDGQQLSAGDQTLWVPQVETARRGDRFVIRADLPGMKKDDIRIHVDDDAVSISGERRSHQQEERDGLFTSERSYGSFYRTVPLPEGVNADQCEAQFNDGVLEISLPAPKVQQRQPRQIDIR